MENEHERLEQESRLIFSSLQTHINKVFGEQMPLVDITIIGMGGERVASALTEEQIKAMKCTHARECNEDALYFANVGGLESLCCMNHGETLRTAQQRRNQDATSWFCRELQPDKGDDCMWIIAWKVPEELREAFGLLIWLWYPIPDPADGGETNCFNIYRHKREDIELPEGARWEKINMEEAAHLIGQLIYEVQRGHKPCIIGFAPDYPYDRPDPSLGYSVTKHSCVECTSDMAEPFCFNYKKVADYRDIRGTWQNATIIEYKPEVGRIRAVTSR
jgi:hypothetical protein